MFDRLTLEAYPIIEIDDPPPGTHWRYVFARVDREAGVTWLWRDVPPSWKAYAVARAIDEAMSETSPALASVA
jgi:hypothetical protein